MFACNLAATYIVMNAAGGSDGWNDAAAVRAGALALPALAGTATAQVTSIRLGKQNGFAVPAADGDGGAEAHRKARGRSVWPAWR